MGVAITWLRQPPHCCGQTVVAMLLGKTVEWVINDMQGHRRGTTTEFLVHFLRKNGFSCGKRLVGLRLGDKLPEMAICRLSLPRRGGGPGFRDGWHWVLWAERRFWDPSRPEYVESFPPEYGVITSYLKVS